MSTMAVRHGHDAAIATQCGSLRRLLRVLLGFGAADLVLLNAWVLPALRTVTDVSASRHAAAPVMANAPALEAAPPQLAAAVPSALPVPRLDEPKHMPVRPTAVIQFGHGSWWVTEHSRTALSELVSRLATRSAGQIQVDGHTDDVGERRINQRISEERAHAIALLLIHSGIDPARIDVRGYGEDRPSADGRHRRVEIRIQGAR
jgi:outer membrane protein OmpA-like peptidoglycan-associated protein